MVFLSYFFWIGCVFFDHTKEPRPFFLFVELDWIPSNISCIYLVHIYALFSWPCFLEIRPFHCPSVMKLSFDSFDKRTFCISTFRTVVGFHFVSIQFPFPLVCDFVLLFDPYVLVVYYTSFRSRHPTHRDKAWKAFCWDAHRPFIQPFQPLKTSSAFLPRILALQSKVRFYIFQFSCICVSFLRPIRIVPNPQRRFHRVRYFFFLVYSHYPFQDKILFNINISPKIKEIYYSIQYFFFS